jgi:endonuclease G
MLIHCLSRANQKIKVLVWLKLIGNSLPHRLLGEVCTMQTLRRIVLALVIVVLAPVVAPAQTRDNNLAMGNPSGATTSTTNSNNYLISRSQYALSYNRSRGNPNWVSWHLSTAWLGSTDRSTTFTADPVLTSLNWPRAYHDTYTNSGFDRGHMCPSADRTGSDTDNKATFICTNVVPQSSRNNSGPWASLESYCRSLANNGNELYIISGPWGSGGDSRGVFRYDWTGPSYGGGTITVKVPQWTWKVIVVLPNGSNDVSRVTTSTRTIAVRMPNSDSIASDWRSYRVSIDTIESMTGYNFFSNVPASIQDVIEARVDNQ